MKKLPFKEGDEVRVAFDLATTHYTSEIGWDDGGCGQPLCADTTPIMRSLQGQVFRVTKIDHDTATDVATPWFYLDTPSQRTMFWSDCMLENRQIDPNPIEIE